MGERSNDELGRRLRRLEDRAELHDLVVRYFFACDDDDWDALSEVFSNDAEFAGAFGRDQVVEVMAESRSEMGPTIHTPDGILFTFDEGDDDVAHGVIGAHWELSVDGRTLYGAVRYEDEYVRERGSWRIRRRSHRVAHIGPWEEVATSLTTETPVRWPGRAPAAADLPVSG
ncbi:nuclear transport factor 2 family protein [Conexibacter sp. CPCC 206217]|uniref:nuclear transport factor 2 family protein n=1 Tax=Conexibacter sp. CPCC 206217 TaxID=3064574 RepID=UPI00271A6227|nr:nuclear transport factor 2 family protein [Conexibacter sp. CPCC 206217]MDO8212567.1 nuclear transport factor 2 family protein [Conexibacter sp. CPCC 206217]